MTRKLFKLDCCGPRLNLLSWTPPPQADASSRAPRRGKSRIEVSFQGWARLHHPAGKIQRTKWGNPYPFPRCVFPSAKGYNFQIWSLSRVPIGRTSCFAQRRFFSAIGSPLTPNDFRIVRGFCACVHALWLKSSPC